MESDNEGRAEAVLEEVKPFEQLKYWIIRMEDGKVIDVGVGWNIAWKQGHEPFEFLLTVKSEKREEHYHLGQGWSVKVDKTKNCDY